MLAGLGFCLLIILALWGLYLLLRWSDRRDQATCLKLASKLNDESLKSWWSKYGLRGRRSFWRRYFLITAAITVPLWIIANLALGPIGLPLGFIVLWSWRHGGHTWDAYVGEGMSRGLFSEFASQSRAVTNLKSASQSPTAPSVIISPPRRIIPRRPQDLPKQEAEIITDAAPSVDTSANDALPKPSLTLVPPKDKRVFTRGFVAGVAVTLGILIAIAIWFARGMSSQPETGPTVITSNGVTVLPYVTPTAPIPSAPSPTPLPAVGGYDATLTAQNANSYLAFVRSFYPEIASTDTILGAMALKEIEAARTRNPNDLLAEEASLIIALRSARDVGVRPTHLGTPNALRGAWLQILAIYKPNLTNTYERIQAFYGIDPNHAAWALLADDAVALAQNGTYKFFVCHNAPAVSVIVETRGGHPYLETEADGVTQNNLSQLPNLAVVP